MFGIRSERQLIREIEVNVAYRWFLGLRLIDKVPDASTFSQNRRRRFDGTEVYQEIFDKIVEQAIKAKLVSGTVLYTESTHLKANANKHKYDVESHPVTPLSYIEDLDQAINKDRVEHNKKPLKPGKASRPEHKEKKISKTDPDSGYMVRDGKPKGFFYLDHRTVDGKCNIITDSYATAANLHDSVPYLERLDRQCERFKLSPIAVGLDAGYYTASLCKGIIDREIEPVMGYRRPNKPKGHLAKRLYNYNVEHDEYTCPAGKTLKYSTTNRLGYKEYKSKPNECRSCPLLDKCTNSRNHTKVVTRHVWQESKERADEIRLSSWGKEVYARRKETVERSFADAKQLHGHRYARMRGLARVKEQCLLAAAWQNMKKIATIQSLKNKLWIAIRGLTDYLSPFQILIL